VVIAGLWERAFVWEKVRTGRFLWIRRDCREENWIFFFGGS